MKYTNEEVTSIAGDLLIQDNSGPEKPYEWMDVVGITQRPKDLQDSLYFTTHADGTDGWHNPFDRRPTAAKVAEDKGWHLAIERGVETGGFPSIEVTSLTELSDRLYEEARRKSNPYIIGVTGSVGKTTTVAFLEHLIRETGCPITRFWSKRLTPLLVQCH